MASRTKTHPLHSKPRRWLRASRPLRSKKSNVHQSSARSPGRNGRGSRPILLSPYVSIATKYAEIMTRISSEFGFTPPAVAGLEVYPTLAILSCYISGRLIASRSEES